MTIKEGFAVNDSGRSAVQALSGRLATNTQPGAGRVELKWVAGQRGIPQINTAIESGTEATREIADPDMEILGVNGASAGCTFEAEGGIKLATAGADLDGEIVTPHVNANQTAWSAWTWGTDREVKWEGVFATGSSLAQIVYAAGLKLTAVTVVTTDADQVFFRSVDGATWKVHYSIGNVDTEVDTGVTPVANTVYVFGVEIDASRKAKCYLNGALVCTTAALTDATDLVPIMGVSANGVAAAKHCYVYGMSISRKIGTNS